MYLENTPKYFVILSLPPPVLRSSPYKSADHSCGKPKKYANSVYNIYRIFLKL